MKLRFNCDEEWDAMDGDEARRHCGKCEHSVHDLSAMTELEANALLAGKGSDRLCVRYAVDEAGEVVHRPPPTRPTDRLLAWAAVAAVPLLAVGLGASQGSGPSGASAGGLGGFGLGSTASDDDATNRMQAAIDDALATAMDPQSSPGPNVTWLPETPAPDPRPGPGVEPHEPLTAGPEPGNKREKRMGKIARPIPLMGVVVHARYEMGDVVSIEE